MVNLTTYAKSKKTPQALLHNRLALQIAYYNKQDKTVRNEHAYIGLRIYNIGITCHVVSAGIILIESSINRQVYIL